MEVMMWVTEAAAKAIKLSPRTLEKLRTEGGGPRYVKLGRRIVYDPRDVVAWLEAHKVSSTAEGRDA